MLSTDLVTYALEEQGRASAFIGACSDETVRAAGMELLRHPRLQRTLTLLRSPLGARLVAGGHWPLRLLTPQTITLTTLSSERVQVAVTATAYARTAQP